ncbi:MAG: hypothetical protein KY445_07720 [Armatimonadetes bacterium]|nr:hypothetical protein [Armatimonadota bacterium]
MLLSPEGWRSPWCAHYACDNDVFAHSPIGTRPDLHWWEREGELAWLKMLDKIPTHHPPLWVLLPDVVGDWEATLERSYRYRCEVEARGFKTALALQDGDNVKSVLDFAPDAVFVGGTTAWKWKVAPLVPKTFRPFGIWTHLGRCNGERPIRLARRYDFDSADGTGLCRFFDAQLPIVLRGLHANPAQGELCFE